MLREIRRNYHRLVAFLLSLSMIITNVGVNAGTVFAAENQEEAEESIFMVDGLEILEAIQDVKTQEAFSKEELEEMELSGQKGVVKKYEKLLLPEEGKVYELELDIDTDMVLEGTVLQVFYNEKTKEVVFLYLNESNQPVDCYVNIDGYETKVVMVEAKDTNVLAETEEDIAETEESEEESGKDEAENFHGGSSSGAGDQGSSGSSVGGSLESKSDDGDVEMNFPVGEDHPEDGMNREDVSSVDSTEENSMEDSQDKESEEKNSGEELTDDESNESKDNSGEEAEIDDSKDDVEEKSETDDSKDDSWNDDGKESEADNSKKGEEKSDDAVAEKDEEKTNASSKGESSSKEDSVKEEAGNGSENKENLDKADSGKDNGKQADKDSADKEDSDKDNSSKNDSREDNKSSDNKASDGKDSTDKAEDKSSDQGSKDDASDKASDKSENKTDEGSSNLSLSRYQAVTVADSLDETATKSEIATAEKAGNNQEITDDWEIPGKVYDTITIKETINARAFCVALEDVQKIVEVNQWAEAEIEKVTEEEVNSVVLPAVYTAETFDAEFTVNVPAGAFMEEVDLRVRKIEDKAQLDILAGQAEEALEKQQTVSGILAYDITFISKESGEEVEPLEAVSVNIRMKKSVVSGQKERSEEKEATGVSVVHLPEDGKAEVVAATENIEETNFEFEAESFSIFVVATVAEVEEAAIVGDERFDTLQAAIDAVTGEDDVIYLLHDVTENIISKGKSYTLEMNEKKITSAVSGKIVYTIEGGNVLIKDGTIQGGRYQGTKNDGKGIKISGTANVTLENCCITDNKGYWSGGGIYADGNSILTLINSDVIGNYASNSGGGIYADGCEITIQGSSRVSGNTANGSGSNISCGIDIRNSSLKIEGLDDNIKVEICDNKNELQTSTANGVYLNNCKAEIKNAKFKNNGYCGFEILNANDKKSIILENVEFSEHRIGSVLYVSSNGSFTARNCSFHDNKLDVKGKSNINSVIVFTTTSVPNVPGTGEKILDSCVFTGNIVNPVNSKETSSAIYINKEKSIVTIKNCEFKKNSGKYGAVYNNSATVNIRDSVFQENEGSDTGAIYVKTGTVNISDTVIKDNKGTNTGAMRIRGTVNVSDTVIKDNHGGVIGGVNVDGFSGKFIMSTGALYGNFVNGVSSDVRWSGSANIVSASEMKDNSKDAYVDFENYIWKTNDKATLTNTIAGALQNDYKNQNNKIQYNSNKVWYAFYEEPEKPPVAQIGEITYSTLEDALEAVKNGETIKLLVEEVPVTQKIAISKKIVIDMNGTKLLNNGFTIVSGGDLTLAGESGEIGDFIKVEKNGLLRIKGNITIKTQSSEAPIKSYGTVFLEHDINELMIDVWAGKFEVAESVNVSGTLRIAMKTESFSAGDKDKEVIINGSVKNLVLKQGIRESKSQATINARVETLELKHTNFAYPSADGQVGKIPTTYIGKNFSAGSIYLIPILGNGNPSYSELVDLREEGKRAADIIMLQSVPGGSISENQIDLEDVTWKCPGELDYDESDSKENYALIHYLVNPAINDKGSLVLRKIVPEMIGGIYLGGEKGDNNNHGASPEAPVASFKKAKELSEETGKPIYIVGAVKVEGTETWTFAENQESEDGSSEAQGNTKTEKAKEKPNLQRHKDYLGELVRVGSKGNLTLQNIIIDGKGVNPMIPAVGSGVDATAPIIVNEGMLNIQYGTILQNNKNVYTNIARNSGGTQFEGGGVWNSGKLNMTGGKIVGNRAVSGAGVFTQGEFKFSGNAVISENTGVILDKYGKEIVHKDDREKTSPSTGAGVFIAYSSGKMEMSGGTISGNSAAAGGGISIGNRNDWYNGGTLTMTGGSIESNEALGSDDFSGGGGIYVQMDGTATIHKGSIIDNKSYKGAYGGGGIYVNGGKSKEHKNGVLNLTKVKISDNTAEGAGGGIAACGTSNVEIRLTDGGIIHGNKGKNVNYDIYYTPGTPEGGGKVEKSDYMLGKGLYEWKRVEGEPLNYLCEYSAAKETTGENLVQVEIRGNYSKTAGGAIGTNGNVYIGTDDDETISIKVIKKWKSDAESTEDMTGEELGSSGGVNEMFTNEGIKIVLRAKLEGEGEDDWREIKSATLKPFQKGNAQWGEWGEIIFNGLQECDANGTKWIYDVVEAEDDRFTVLGKPAFKPNYDSEGKLISYTCTLTNIPTYSLKVSKEVPNFGKYPEYNEDSFKFTITLKHKDGSFYTFDELAALKVKDQESGKELPLPIENINDNEITVVLKHGEFIWLTGLTFGTKYVVKEDSNEDYDTLIKLITYNEGGSPGDTTAFSPDKFKEETVKLGTNAVIFENTVRTPLGKLRISKMVEDGDQKKAWKFTIVFQNQDGTQLGTAASKYPITKYSGIADQEGITKKIAIPGGRLTETLKHGESLEIADLPAGTKYIVTEDEANTDNYTTTVTGEGVTEVIKELTQDGQEVKKIVIGGNGNIVKDEIAHIMFTNTLNTGSLSMEKTVIGAGGDRLKSFVFTVALTGKDNKPLTGTYSYTGIATEEGVNAPAPDVLTLNARGEGQISLKHGQKITISGLPAGTSYKVTEDEANQDGYTTEETDGTGIIVKDEEKTAKFVNDKPKTPEETTTPAETPEEPTTPDESTPEESTPEETTPEESSPEESTPEESTPEETTPEETTPEETTPEETTPQETQPPAPSNPSGGGGGGRRRRITESTPPPTAEETPIPPEEVPLVSIEPEEIPLAMLPSDNSKDLTVIDDGGVALFGLPRTGDKSIPTGALIGMMFVSLMTACGIHVKKRKEKE